MAATVLNRMTRLRGDQLAKPDAISRLQDNVGQVVDPIANAVAQTPLVGQAPNWLYPNFADGSWVNLLLTGNTPPFIGTSAKLAFHMDCLGYVHIKGVVKTTAGRAAASLLFTLPAGFAPKEIHFFPVSNNGALGSLAIYPTGAVQAPIMAINTVLALGDLMFLAEGGGTGSLGGGAGGGGISPHG